jgi:dTDP-4-dehydrorhamnose 3,5-epimerase
MPVRVMPLRRFEDERGWFCETWSLTVDVAEALPPFVQDNQSFSRRAGTIRGLHFQAPPFAQAKLIRVLRGRILDVALDIRKSSPDYGRWMARELCADRPEQLFIPVGFAHGFLTLAPDTQVLYKVSSPYAKACEGGINWQDPALALPLPDNNPTLSSKDRMLPALAECDSPFLWDGTPFSIPEGALTGPHS